MVRWKVQDWQAAQGLQALRAFVEVMLQGARLASLAGLTKLALSARIVVSARLADLASFLNLTSNFKN